MKTRFTSLIVLLFACGANVFAHSEKISDFLWATCEKTYVESEHLAITPEGIFVKIFEEWIMTPAIHFDEKGLYFDACLKDDLANFSWTCPECDYENSTFRRSCKQCGFTPRH
ncbi:MAG: hypothetical protein ACM3JI_01065 [Anaerolineae bacterium]